jgi:D-arginine dehydrogenase
VIHDVAIIGAGIAGATLAAELVPDARVLLLEAEDIPGYHATGRSAAFWSETYGGPAIQPLTSASRAAFDAGGFLSPMGSLHIGTAADAAAIDDFMTAFADTDVVLERVDPATRVSGLREQWTLGVWEPSCAYIDVAALHAAALASARRGGAVLATGAGVQAAARDGGVWTLTTRAGAFQARILVNAGGAWADPVARIAGAAPIGVAPYRRTMVQLRTDPAAPDGLPMVADIGGRFYFKPEAGGRLWLSPHDEIPADPGDAQPEELDVAVAIDRFEQVLDWHVAAVERRWAGLRSFAPDRRPVYGYDPAVAGFFWCAGQGGFGIQTAPAAAMVGAALLLGRTPNAAIDGIDLEQYSPGRFDAGQIRRSS